MRWTIVAFFAAGSLFLTPPRLPGASKEEIKNVTLTVDHKEAKVDVSSPEKLDAFLANLKKALHEGSFEELKPYKQVNILDLKWDLALWSIVVFLLLYFILKTKAWGPILEGLQKREAHIRASHEEAKIARDETAKLQARFKAEMDAKFAEIPKIMEEARRDAEALKEELRTQANKEIQADRQRLRREIDSARDQALKDIWEQAAQLATLISAKVIAKTLTPEDHRRLIDESLVELRENRPQITAGHN